MLSIKLNARFLISKKTCAEQWRVSRKATCATIFKVIVRFIESENWNKGRNREYDCDLMPKAMRFHKFHVKKSCKRATKIWNETSCLFTYFNISLYLSLFPWANRGRKMHGRLCTSDLIFALKTCRNDILCCSLRVNSDLSERETYKKHVSI